MILEVKDAIYSRLSALNVPIVERTGCLICEEFGRPLDQRERGTHLVAEDVRTLDPLLDDVEHSPGLDLGGDQPSSLAEESCRKDRHRASEDDDQRSHDALHATILSSKLGR